MGSHVYNFPTPLPLKPIVVLGQSIGGLNELLAPKVAVDTDHASTTLKKKPTQTKVGFSPTSNYIKRNVYNGYSLSPLKIHCSIIPVSLAPHKLGVFIEAGPSLAPSTAARFYRVTVRAAFSIRLYVGKIASRC
jgi:hypothetical protein